MTTNTQPQSKAKTDHKEIPPWVHFVAGGVGGTVSMIITCPLEVIKTRLQGTEKAIYDKFPFGQRTLYAFKEILSTEGFKGLWRGVGPNLLGVAPSRAIHFAAYSWMKDLITNKLHLEEGKITYLLAASVAAMSTATATAPIWLVKTRIQLQRNVPVSELKPGVIPYKSAWNCAIRVYKEEGIRSFYRGLTASYYGVSETALQFMLYEKLKWWTQERKFIKKNPNSTVDVQVVKSLTLSPFEYLSVASLAKLIASAATYPHEVVRTRLREANSHHKYKSFWQTLRLIAAEEGVAGLYGGMGAHLLRVVPNAAILFFTYETVVKLLM